jgi:cobalt-precorrin-7 (C5)-methyltransferase
MKIIGVGCGPGLLTEQAIRELKAARTVYGSDRAIEIARPYLSPSCRAESIDDFKALSRLPEDSVILSTGDPMLAGLGYLPGEVVPGISSLQLATARLHIPWARLAVVVAHGRGHEKGMADTLEEVKRGKIVFLLADPKFDTGMLCARLRELGIPLQVAVCENLGYPEEKIAVGPVESPPPAPADLYSLVIGSF